MSHQEDRQARQAANLNKGTSGLSNRQEQIYHQEQARRRHEQEVQSSILKNSQVRNSSSWGTGSKESETSPILRSNGGDDDLAKVAAFIFVAVCGVGVFQDKGSSANTSSTHRHHDNPAHRPVQQYTYPPVTIPSYIEITEPAAWAWNAERDAPAAYDAHVNGMLLETGINLKMEWQEAERHGAAIISTLLSKPVTQPRYAFVSQTSTGETIAVASAAAGNDGSISSIGCISADGQITHFGKTTTSYTDEGKLVYAFTREAVTYFNGKEINLTTQASHMGDCRRALSLLKQNYDLPELGSPHIN
jgi:hypothetical protein